MKTAIDTNILLDVLGPDPEYGLLSKALLEERYRAGGLVICDIVYSELASCFDSQEKLDEMLAALQIQVIPLNKKMAYAAGQLFLAYRKKGGDRSRILPDFLIAAHAREVADGFATRDRGFYRSYFPKIRLFDPTEGKH